MELTVEILRTELAKELAKELAPIKAQLDGMDARFDGMDERFDRLEARVDRLEKHMDEGFHELQGRIHGVIEIFGDHYRDHERRLTDVERSRKRR